MEFTVVQTDDHRTFVKLTGSLDAVTVGRITLDFSRHVAMHRRTTIVDLSGVEFIASLAMGMLVTNARALQRFAAKMILANPGAVVERALRNAGIDEIIPIGHGPKELEALLAG
jgi:anti-sigma B factor antagonist